MGVSKNKGTPKWMVYFMENPIKMDDLGGKTPLFLVQHPYLSEYVFVGVAFGESTLPPKLRFVNAMIWIPPSLSLKTSQKIPATLETLRLFHHTFGTPPINLYQQAIKGFLS